MALPSVRFDADDLATDMTPDRWRKRESGVRVENLKYVFIAQI
jgi:hypothetical protein